MSSISTGSSSSNRSSNMGLCECKIPLPLKKRTSWTSTNPARRFLVCPNSMYSWKKCKAFHWLDDELQNDWYKSNLFELYGCLNRDQRYSFHQIMNFREMCSKLEADFELYKREMVMATGMLEQEVKKNKEKASFYMKLAFVLLVVIALMLLF